MKTWKLLLFLLCALLPGLLIELNRMAGGNPYYLTLADAIIIEDYMWIQKTSSSDVRAYAVLRFCANVIRYNAWVYIFLPLSFASPSMAQGLVKTVYLSQMIWIEIILFIAELPLRLVRSQ